MARSRAAVRTRRCWIDPQDFRHTRLAARLTVDQAAALLFVSSRTVRYWEAGRARIPYAAFKLLKVLRGHGLPGEAWAGWTVTQEALWSPAGHRFLPGELEWLSLVFRQAQAFRVVYRKLRRLQRHGASEGHLSPSPTDRREAPPLPRRVGGAEAEAKAEAGGVALRSR